MYRVTILAGMTRNEPASSEADDPIEVAARIMGSQTALAQALGITKGAVHQWKLNGVPAERCPDVELVTHGRVRCEQLRPDVKWWVVRGHKRAPRAR